MGYPKKVIKSLPLEPKKTLYARRQQLLEYINKDGTYLPKSVLHSDLDRGMLDFVKEDLRLVTAGKLVPLIDIIITTQNWTQFTETWNFVDQDFNVKPPFITVVRNPDVKYGTNPSLQYTIPNRKEFYYASVPTWNGNQEGMDIYKIPQPVPVDMTFNVRIVCNRMRELNEFNKIVLQKFSSRQAYTFIKGQYVPIIMNNISDESVSDLDKRKYYVQNYDFTMLGYLIDEDEFEVSPAISRVLTMMEVSDGPSIGRKRKSEPPNTNTFVNEFLFVSGTTVLSEIIDTRVNVTITNTTNISSFDIFINNQYYGSSLDFVGEDMQIFLDTNDILRVEVTKNDNSQNSIIQIANRLV
jgi:hypothetical protein